MEQTYSEETPTYKRIAGKDIAGDPKAAIQVLVDKFRDFDITPHMLKEFDTFEQTLVATMIMKFQLLVRKQTDYGPNAIHKVGLRGVLNYISNKLDRANTLIGDPESQLERIKVLLLNLDDDADTVELDQFATNVSSVIFPNTAVRDENIDDTLMDLANYGDIGYIHYHGSWGKPMEKN